MQLSSIYSKSQLSEVCEESDGIDINLFRSAMSLMETISLCNALKSKVEIKAASFLVDKLGILLHNDYQKNWDTLKALYYVIKATGPTSNILDAGGGLHSPILNTLSMFKYNNLYACDVVDVNYSPERFSKLIKFSLQNIENTDYPDEFYDAVTCLSVVEHGIDPNKFFAEMCRIVKKDGLLIITTDYWPEYIDCSGIYPYGPDAPEMKVYTARDIKALVQIGNAYGFELCTPLILDVEEKAVRWDEVDREYTFIFLALKKSVNK